jgi:predicted ATP-grasp superfamily ATP-dependent carboligase
MESLYRVYSDAADIQGLPMVAILSGFTDAGSSISQLSDHLFANLDNELAVSFDNDQLLDYRSRRPVLFFEKDHIESYEPTNLGIYLMHDEADQPFLLLDGYEPDFRWESFSKAVLSIVEQFSVTSFTWIHSIPFPIPHTRSVGVTVSGNRSDMIERFSEWKPQTQVPGNIVHLLEYRLSAAGLPTAGFVLLVPHYIADNEVPSAAITALEMISAATGLIFPTDEIRDRNRAFLQKVAAQVEENPELQKLVSTLEQGYQSSENAPAKAPIGKPQSAPPSADQIAEELENYLATMRRNGQPEE